MHGEPSSILDDAALLREWVAHRSEAAFAQIVEHYEKLVVATASRRTGNVESARDVAQQVFAMLAAKAPLLVGRRNIGGWLYYAASHLGARALRTERRRTDAQNQASVPQDGGREADQGMWDSVEDAMSALGQADRDAIVMHYLQDRSYPEMAAALRISEAAARKRVSRALQSLEERLRVRGVSRSAAAILATVAAQQSATITSGAAALATATIASSGAISTPLPILMTTAMTQTTTKAAATLAAMCIVPLTLQWNANANLRQEIAAARSHPPTAAILSEKESEPGALRRELAAKQSAIIAAENQAAELAELKRKLETEVVYSMGSVESMARELARATRAASTIEAMQAALKKAQAIDPNSEETKRLRGELKQTAVEAAALMPRAIALMRELLKIERSPEKAARFYATFLGEAGGLDEAIRMKVEARLVPWITELQRDGLALPQRPKTIERVEWDQRRSAATMTMMQTLAAEFSTAQWQNVGIDQLLGGGKDADWLDLFLSEDDNR